MKFTFKQFTVKQERSAMKVGTDGVLLGAWTSLDNQPLSILDIGAGTGIISLLLAQRSLSETIDAVELDENAYEECVDNFEASDWGDRLFCYHTSAQQFAEEIDDKYSLIVSNPPFYTDHFKSENKARNKARFTDSLSFKDLTKAVSKLLSSNGIFTLIIPFKEETNFISIASEYHLFPNKICRVKGNINSEIKRSLIEFSLVNSKVSVEELILENSRHHYTEKYKNLVKDFYLKL